MLKRERVKKSSKFVFGKEAIEKAHRYDVGSILVSEKGR